MSTERLEKLQKLRKIDVGQVAAWSEARWTLAVMVSKKALGNRDSPLDRRIAADRLAH
jgi:hypothetical protein